MVKPNPPTEEAVPARQKAMRRIIAGVALVFGTALSATAASPDYAAHDVGGWTVAASKDGDGCFVTKAYDRAGETTLLLGLAADGANRLSVLNANWSIRPKDRLKLTFRLSTARFPDQFAVGMTSAGKQGFVTSFGPKFPAQFAASRDLRIFRGDVPVERLNLEGSGEAVSELRRCVDIQGAKPAISAGKKERADSIPTDPFAPASARKSKR